MEGPSECKRVQYETVPGGLSAGSNVLVAGTVDPSRYAIGLEILCQLGQSDDTALVVTTTESADQTVDRYERLGGKTNCPALALVDTTSEQQSISAPYGDHPVVFIPAPGDLERLVVGLSELTSSRPPESGTRHLLVRSLTPLLENTATDDVCAILERISGLRTGDGLNLFGLRYTAHDEETVSAVSRHVDAILWVSEQFGKIEFDWSPTNGRNNAVSEVHSQH